MVVQSQTRVHSRDSESKGGVKRANLSEYEVAAYGCGI